VGGLSATIVSRAKTVERIEMSFGLWQGRIKASAVPGAVPNAGPYNST